MAEKTQKINQRKKDRVKEIKDFISGAKDIIFTDYRGMSVPQLTDLRTKLGDEESIFKVIKNSYSKIAFQELELPVEEEFLIGPTALTLIKKDAGPVAKILLNCTKDMTLAVKGGIIDGRIFDKDEITALSKLPGRDELYASLLGSLNAPATNLVLVLNAVATKLVRTLQAVADKKKNE
ncbi:MAG: 50S ribosomal protein L10 [Spirochaetales bacterium]|nr:50S ribosomal protein L10 [Spirochaetales bacterium]